MQNAGLFKSTVSRCSYPLRRPGAALCRLTGARLAAITLAALAATAISVSAAAAGSVIAAREVGQVDFVHTSPNFLRGTGFDFGGTAPAGIAIDPVNHYLYVADTNNSRVLGWLNAATFVSGSSANIVIGQADRFTRGCNVGGTSLATLCGPTGAAVDGAGNLYVSDQGNQRVLKYPNPFLQSGRITASASFAVPDPWGLAFDSGGHLFVVDRNDGRVLVFTPAVDSSPHFVFGQDGDLTRVGCNTGTKPGDVSGLGPDSLCGPNAVAIDGADVYIADSLNSRVLKYTNPIATNKPTASLVLGQSKFTTAACNANGLSGATLCGPHGVAVDPHHNVYVSDTSNNRALEFDTPTANDPVANLVIGQANAISNAPNRNGTLTAQTLYGPSGASTDASGNLYLIDYVNDRVLEYNESNPPANGTANKELGQGDFVHSTVNFIGPPSLSNVTLIAIDRTSSSNHLYIADPNNNRVLAWTDAAAFSNGAPANLVIGQPDPFTVNCVDEATGGITAATLCLNATTVGGGVAVDSQHNLYVADTANSRVLEFASPFASGKVAGQSAIRVLGKSNFTTGHLGIGCSGPTSQNLCDPTGLALDAHDNLYVADPGFNRVLEYATPRLYSGTTPEPAHLVFGQKGSFTSGACNLGGAASATTLCAPVAVVMDALNDLLVSDASNNRVLEYHAPLANPLVPNTTANLVFGQGTPGNNFTATKCGAASASTLCGPGGVTVDPFGAVFIADASNNRVLHYRQSALPPTNVTADLEFGHGVTGTNFTATNCNDNGPASASTICIQTAATTPPYFPPGVDSDRDGNLYMADNGNFRVLAYNGPFEAVPTATPTITRTPRPTPTLSRSSTRTRTPTHSSTHIVTRTPSPSASKTPTRTASRTPTKTPTRTPSRTPSRTPTHTPRRTPTPTRTP